MDDRLAFATGLARTLRLTAGTPVDLVHGHDPSATPGVARREDGESRLAEGLALLSGLQERLAGEATRAVLLVLQGLDAAGKDGTIRHVMSGVNAQGVEVRSFKQPSLEELAHDWLWRYHRATPERGRIGIFNRSHYEEVLVVRVHPELLAREGGRDADSVAGERHGDHGDVLAEAGKDTWHRRYRAINAWEEHLEECGTRVVKVALHISRREQAKRFVDRIDDESKNWKFSEADLAEHRFYDDYQRAFSAMLEATTTGHAPWHVVPADHKWYARLATASIVVAALADLDPQFPRPDPEARRRMAAARPELEAEIAAERSPG